MRLERIRGHVLCNQFYNMCHKYQNSYLHLQDYTVNSQQHRIPGKPGITRNFSLYVKKSGIMHAFRKY